MESQWDGGGNNEVAMGWGSNNGLTMAITGGNNGMAIMGWQWDEEAIMG